MPSLHGPVETLDRLEAAVTRHGMTIFGRIDHGAAAEEVGMELKPGATWLAYNDPAWLFRRHGIDNDGTAAVMNDVLANVAGEAAGR